jgi:TPR repeat protein
MKHTFLRRAVPAMLSVSLLGVVAPAFAQAVPSPQASSPAASASSTLVPSPNTVDFLFSQFVKAQQQANPAPLSGLLEATLADPRVMEEVRSQAIAGNPKAQVVLGKAYSHGWGGVPQDNAQAAA